MEDDLKMLKVEYLRNHWSDLPKILSLGLGDLTKIKNSWNEDDLQWKTNSQYEKLSISTTTGQIFFFKFETLAEGTIPTQKIL